MTAHTERLAKFEEEVYRQREEMQAKMTEMMNLVKEFTKTKVPEKVLVRSNDCPPTSFVNAISIMPEDGKVEVRKTEDSKREEAEPNDEPETIEYYLKQEINRKTIANQVNNFRYNEVLREALEGKMTEEEYDALPMGPLYELVIIKTINKKMRHHRELRDTL